MRSFKLCMKCFDKFVQLHPDDVDKSLLLMAGLDEMTRLKRRRKLGPLPSGRDWTWSPSTPHLCWVLLWAVVQMQPLLSSSRYRCFQYIYLACA